MVEYIESPSGKKYYTREYVETLREADLVATGDEPIKNFIAATGFQEKVLTSMADFTIIGGKRGGGKSRAMNMVPLYGLDVVGYGCNGFRKEEQDVREGLWTDAVELYRGFGEITDSSMIIKFNNGASKIVYSHLQNEENVDRRFRGRQMPCILIDELSQFQEKTFFTMVGSNRNTLGIRNKFVASTNPVGDDHWIFQLIKWYIDPVTLTIIPERSGVMRYFYRPSENVTDIIWGDTREEVYELAKHYIDDIYDESLEGSVDKMSLIASFVFIEGQLSENKTLNKKDTSYLGRLNAQGSAQAYRDIKGIWQKNDSSYGLLSRSDLDATFEASPNITKGFRCATADVALSGDYFEMFAFEDKHVIDWEAFTGISSTTAADLVRKFLNRNGIREENFAYDSNGLGLYLQGHFGRAKKFNNKERASNPKLWSNQKSECADNFVLAIKNREYSFADGLLEKSVNGTTLRNRLIGQRPALKRKETDSGRFELISKQQMKIECGHSPDTLEALFMRETFNGSVRRTSNMGLL